LIAFQVILATSCNWVIAVSFVVTVGLSVRVAAVFSQIIADVDGQTDQDV